MKERPILFNTEMVTAIISGRKTQTRRIVKSLPHLDAERAQNFYREQWDWLSHDGARLGSFDCPLGSIGDRLWVRETFRLFDQSDECSCYDVCSCPKTGTPIYRATNPCLESLWAPSIHMPRSASRITLEITDVRVERLQDISDEDAKEEGLDNSERIASIEVGWYEKPKRAFRRLWESIYGNESWNENPWVWVVDFKVIKINKA